MRAQGFCGSAFEKAVGENRYLWLKKLGNERIGTGRQGIKIADPTGVDDLLQYIADADKQNRRVIFFCNCERPCNCHRAKVARLLVRSASRRGIALSVVEWPGGEPRTISLSVSDSVLNKVLRGANRVPLDGLSLKSLHEIAALPWGSRVRLCSDVRDIAIVSGPAKLAPCWYLPLLGPAKSGETDTIESLAEEAARKREALGYLPIESAL